MNEWGNYDSDILRPLNSAYKKNRTIFFHACLPTCLKQDTSVLLKFISTSASS